MPVYEYRCDQCDQETDRIVPFSLSEGLMCTCGGRLVKLPSTFLTGERVMHKFYKEGEGFTSKHYSKEEYNYRLKEASLSPDPI